MEMIKEKHALSSQHRKLVLTFYLLPFPTLIAQFHGCIVNTFIICISFLKGNLEAHSEHQKVLA